MKIVKTEFILYYQKDNYGSTDPDSKSGNIYERKYFVSPKISDGNDEIIFDHKNLVC